MSNLKTRYLGSALYTSDTPDKKTYIHYFANAGHGFWGLDEFIRKNLVVEFLLAN